VEIDDRVNVTRRELAADDDVGDLDHGPAYRVRGSA
jgi:hypothetical protein